MFNRRPHTKLRPETAITSNSKANFTERNANLILQALLISFAKPITALLSIFNKLGTFLLDYSHRLSVARSESFEKNKKGSEAHSKKASKENVTEF